MNTQTVQLRQLIDGRNNQLYRVEWKSDKNLNYWLFNELYIISVI